MVRWITAALALVVAAACTAPREGPPARLVAGRADTVIVNNRLAFRIPVHALSAAGDSVPATGVRFQWLSGDSIPVSGAGTVMCAKRGDAAVRASVKDIATTMLLRCRPVRSVRIAGPVQFILGDSAETIRFQVLGLDGKPEQLLAGTVTVRDSGLVAIEGLRLRPISVGGSGVSLLIGNEQGYASVHVYLRATTLDTLRTGLKFVGVPLSLAGGETAQFHLPPGQWMLTMMPYEDEDRGLRLRVANAVCMPATITRRRIVCENKIDAPVFVDHPGKASGPRLTGTLLVRRVNS